MARITAQLFGAPTDPQGVFSIASEVTFGARKPEPGDVIELAPELLPDTRLMDFKVFCDATGLVFQFGPLNGPFGESNRGLHPFVPFEALQHIRNGGVILPRDGSHVAFDMPGCAFGLTVLQAPSLWQAAGRRISALLTFAKKETEHA